MAGPTRWLVVLIGVLLATLAGSAWAGGPGKKPTVTGLSVSDVAPTSAVLKGTVTPEGQATTYQFEYGTTPSYGLHTPVADAGDGESAEPVFTPVEGLQPETVYHYRLVATNSGGTSYTADKTFFPLAQPPGETPPPGPGLVTPDAAAPVAKLGESVLVAPASGVLMVRLPGSSSFEPLALGSQLPVGTEVDARRGSLALTAALPNGTTETGRFGGGRFKLGQDKRGYVDLYLRGRYCTRATASAASVASAAARKKPGRRLWGRDHGGRFRTHGRNSHATVRGTRWLVVDTCKGTYTRVTQGSVVVRDKVRKKRIVLDAGEHYLARPRR